MVYYIHFLFCFLLLLSCASRMRLLIALRSFAYSSSFGRGSESTYFWRASTRACSPHPCSSAIKCLEQNPRVQNLHTRVRRLRGLGHCCRRVSVCWQSLGSICMGGGVSSYWKSSCSYTFGFFFFFFFLSGTTIVSVGS